MEFVGIKDGHKGGKNNILLNSDELILYQLFCLISRVKKKKTLSVHLRRGSGFIGQDVSCSMVQKGHDAPFEM